MSSRWYWWKEMEWFSVALATWIGTVTRPKLMAPLQMVRGMADLRVSPEQNQATAGAALPHAYCLVGQQAEVMASVTRVVVYPPDEGGGRRVRVDGTILGLAYGVRDVAALLQMAGLQEVDEMDVVRSERIDWRGGGPEAWTH
jgi:hypothetical protein